MLSTNSLTEDMEVAKTDAILYFDQEETSFAFLFNHLYSVSLNSVQLWERWQKENKIRYFWFLLFLVPLGFFCAEM